MTVSSSSDAGGSQTVTLSTAFDRSRTAESVRTVRRWSESAWIFAAVCVFKRWLTVILSQWISGSVLCMTVFDLIHRSGTTLLQWVRHSNGYRWVTADPDPDVIVIDLRETRTLGPLLGVIDQVLAVGLPAVSHARTRHLWLVVVRRFVATPLRYVGAGLAFVAAVGAVRLVMFGSDGWAAVGGVLGVALVALLFLTDGRSWAELRTARPVRVLAAVFAPPEPPEESSAGIETDRDDQSDHE